MAIRKGWDSLSDNYRRRLLSNGISEAEYSQGKKLYAARGHKATPERKGSFTGLARRTGIYEIVEDFDELDPEMQKEVAQNWVQGFMSKSRGPIRNPDRKPGQKIIRGASDAQIIARMDFTKFVNEYQDGMTSEQWKAFREQYRSTFSAAT